MSRGNMDSSARDHLISIDRALRLTPAENAAYHRRHVNPRLATLLELIGAGKPLVRASGSYYWDSDGTRVLDFLSAFGALPFGHNPAAVHAAVDRVSELPNLVEGLSLLSGALAHNLAQIAPATLTRVFFANSGTEVVDAAVKLAKAATGRPGLVACRGAFHGRSIGALSLMDGPTHQQPFGALLPDVSHVGFGDLEALERVLSKRTVAALLIEPVQAEAGMVVPPDGYLHAARDICAHYGTLFVADEVQTGLCRTGCVFAVDHEQVIPDVLLLGKALGGGVMPLSALLTSDTLFRDAGGGTAKSPFHESTYAANTRACAAGMATLHLLLAEKMHVRAASAGAYLIGRLRDLQSVCPTIAAVRGRGLMVGIEWAPPMACVATRPVSGVVNRLSHEYFSGLVIRELLTNHRIMTAYTLNNPNVLRLQPALDVTREQIDTVVESLATVLSSRWNLARVAGRSWTALLKARFT